MEVTGISVKQTAIREGVSKSNGNPWKIGEYLLEVPGQYPRHINFRVSDGQVGRLARFDSLIGKTVTVSFDIDAHEYNGRWFNDVRAFRIDRGQAAPTATPEAAPAPEAPVAPAAPQVDAAATIPFEAPSATDDLPF